MNLIKKIALLATLILFFGNNIFAQPSDPCTDPLDPCSVPIDDNVWILFIAAISIALYKVFTSNKKLQNL